MRERPSSITRRQLLAGAGGLVTALPVLERALGARSSRTAEGETVLPFLDPTPAPPREELARLNTRGWSELTDWITPNDAFFEVAHYDQPEIDAASYRLGIGGLVANPRSLSLDQLEALPRREVVYTLECAGNNGFPWFVGGLGTARWAGTPLAPLLEQAGPRDEGIEVVFYGRDSGEEEFARQKVPQSFARSMSLTDALDANLMLAYEMNGRPLPRSHGYPIRLIAPGWYGIANVKWLDRIEVWPTRYAGRFMARDYVTVREEPRPGGGSVVTQKVVGRSLIMSAPVKLTERDGRVRVHGAAWGRPIGRVEVRADGGPWLEATIDQGEGEAFAWKFWHTDLPGLTAGEHSVTSRAIDRDGNVQPAADDPVVAKKLTYWESNGQITRRFLL